MSHKGFTLLELIVVLVLIGLSASMTLPRLSQTLDAVNANVEERTFLELVDGIRLRAFLRQQNISISCSGHSLSINEENNIISFRFLLFNEQQVTWNGNGFPDTTSLQYMLRGQNKELLLF